MTMQLLVVQIITIFGFYIENHKCHKITIKLFMLISRKTVIQYQNLSELIKAESIEKPNNIIEVI